MRRPPFRLVVCLLSVLAATPAVAQKGHKPASPPACPAPTPGKLTQVTTLPNGDVMYYGRFLMYTPEGNSCAYTNRQLRLSLPRLQNDDPAHPTAGNAPVIQATMETLGIGLNDQMVIYSIIRGTDSVDSAFIRFDAAVFLAKQTPTRDFYLNVTVIGHPMKQST